MSQLYSPQEIWPDPKSKWVVRFLGRISVASSLGEHAKFRSKSVTALMAFLCLRKGEFVSRFMLEELLWPESDGDRQAQNLRKAVADLRDALGAETGRDTFVETQRDVVRLKVADFALDVERFIQLTNEGLAAENAVLLLEAVQLYGGPLLPSLDQPWVYDYRLDFEERFCQAVDVLCQRKIADSLPNEAIRIGRNAVLHAPNREDLHIALIRAYRASGLEAEAIRQFEDLERILDETWGEVPSPRAYAALAGPLDTAPPKTVSNPLKSASLESEPTGGAVPLNSRWYLRRKSDELAESALGRGESVILIQGPRQVGKSSLLARLLDQARNGSVATVLSDFQTFGETQLGDEELLYKTLAHSVSSQLQTDLDLEKTWSSWLGPNMNLDAVLGLLLAQKGGRVCWAIDEADRIFGRPYANDFFGLLRSWHNRRALDPGGPWSNLTLVLSYAAEAHLFITDINQSPFNVGMRLPLRDFSMSEVTELAARYGISGEEEISTVFRTTNGHPFLTRRALSFLSQSGSSTELESSCSLPDGPFGDHLQVMLGSILQDSELVSEVKRLLVGEPIENTNVRYRLAAAGVLSNADNAAQFRVPAYRPYLLATLG